MKATYIFKNRALYCKIVNGVHTLITDANPIGDKEHTTLSNCIQCFYPFGITIMDCYAQFHFIGP